MFAHMQPEARINNKTYQQARLAGLGTPLRAYRNTFLRIINIFCLLISIASAVWLCYLIYAYFAFIPLAKKYPTLLAVPLHQLDQYLWLEIMHDSFWYSSLTVVMILLSSLLAFFFYSIGFNTKIYICTEGLLKVEKGKIEAIRWDEVKRLYTTRGNVISLLRKDDSRFTIDNLFYRQPTNRKLSTLIANEASRVRLPHLLEQFERGKSSPSAPCELVKKVFMNWTCCSPGTPFAQSNCAKDASMYLRTS